jgi:uncharacterized phage-associated protein
VATIANVAAYILQQSGPMTTMKLQKLCYYSYGFHLAWEDRKLFHAHFEAWANGPVAPELYQMHRGRFELSEGDIKGDPQALDGGEQESVNLVLQSLGQFTAHQLSTYTHAELPWQLARERAGASGLERASEPLKDPDIYEYFAGLLATAAEAE